jgi:hypothetical protein
MHIWRISERARLDSTPASIVEDMILARRYFDESVQLNPSDARTRGFLASALMGEGAIERDERLTRTGYFTIAPHNAEGFFLNMGDMLVKSGDWRTAQTMYGNAKLVLEYSSWPFAAVLDERIRSAELNVARFSGHDPNPRTGMMGDSAFSCMACHQR